VRELKNSGSDEIYINSKTSCLLLIKTLGLLVPAVGSKNWRLGKLSWQCDTDATVILVTQLQEKNLVSVSAEPPWVVGIVNSIKRI